MDIIFCILPKVTPNGPLVGPATLKACLSNEGFTSKVLDLNVDLFENIHETHRGAWYDEDRTFFDKEVFREFCNEVLGPHLNRWVDDILKLKPKWVGLSMFSNRSALITEEFARRIRKANPNIKIVVGGAGAYFRGHQILQTGVIDYYIVGEAEVALVELLKGNTTYPGINSRNSLQLFDLDRFPIPDYSDIDFSRYQKLLDDKVTFEPVTIYTTGSRGCVRRCSFCDVATQWPKFRFRSGHSIATEIVEVYDKYIKDMNVIIQFTDSLINGSMKSFKELCQELSAVKKRLPNIKWEGQFICRSEQQMPEEDYATLKLAGGETFFIGIESGSESVRNHMQKQFSNEDMWFMLSMFHKYKISANIMLVVGYPTETEKDFQETLNMISEMSELGYFEEDSTGYCTIRTVSLGPTLEIYENTPLEEMSTQLGIYWDDQKEWVFGDNNKKLRIERLIRSHEHYNKKAKKESSWLSKARLEKLKSDYEKHYS